MDDRALLSVKDLCKYMGIGESVARKILNEPSNSFTVRIGGRIFAHKASLDKWLINQVAR